MIITFKTKLVPVITWSSVCIDIVSSPTSRWETLKAWPLYRSDTGDSFHDTPNTQILDVPAWMF